MVEYEMSQATIIDSTSELLKENLFANERVPSTLMCLADHLQR